ncbi:hypothetical protein MLD38_021422 [Melastoma candidum]|uniref:Uncharacterized protein n=1 Tax=Melastoma candidum TaxID=119954 RepID=A0ACB9QP58_9MYRT|nr:hypothetical protein MLD38_021422 [Melastoma candidum]
MNRPSRTSKLFDETSSSDLSSTWKPFVLYVAATATTVGALLVQEDEQKKKRAVFYLSRLLNPAETRYTASERLCLSVYYTVTKLRHYIGNSEVHVVSRAQVLRTFFESPLLTGRVSKWSLVLSTNDLKFKPQKAVKGQVLADFLAEYSSEASVDKEDEEPQELWEAWFDGSSTRSKAGIGIVKKSPTGFETKFAFKFAERTTNNATEYNALIVALQTLLESGAKVVVIKGDSQLVVNQVNGLSLCHTQQLRRYLTLTQKLIKEFQQVTLEHISRKDNTIANALAQLASRYKSNGALQKEIGRMDPEISSPITKQKENDSTPIYKVDVMKAEEDRRLPYIEFLGNPNSQVERMVKLAAMLVLLENLLYRKTKEGVQLRCVDLEEATPIMLETHEGLCGTHQSGVKMYWMIQRHGFYWPSMRKNCNEPKVRTYNSSSGYRVKSGNSATPLE